MVKRFLNVQFYSFKKSVLAVKLKRKRAQKRLEADFSSNSGFQKKVAFLGHSKTFEIGKTCTRILAHIGFTTPFRHDLSIV